MIGEGAAALGTTALARTVIDGLGRRGIALVTAESCTAGLLAATLAAVPGASRVLAGGYVAYQPALKTRLLDVPRSLLDQAGPVSEQVVAAMARGAQERAAVDCAVATSCSAGPTAEAGSAVGDAAVALVHGRETAVMLRRFAGTREEIHAAVVSAALRLLVKHFTLTVIS